MDWKTCLKQFIKRYTNIRLYRYTLPRGVDFFFDARNILIPDKVSVIFDVGANIGQSANRFQITYPNSRILCFEPVSTIYEELNHRIKAWRRVEAYRLALGDESNTKSMHISASGDTSINSFVNAYVGEQLERVQVQTLDSFCHENNIENIDLLKIDVEGYELEVLQGAQRMLSEHRIKSLYLESTVHNNQEHYFVPLSVIDDYLSSFGYSIFGIYEQERDQLRNIDYLYFFNVAYIATHLCEKHFVK